LRTRPSKQARRSSIEAPGISRGLSILTLGTLSMRRSGHGFAEEDHAA
jgi:hypothetical protein